MRTALPRPGSKEAGLGWPHAQARAAALRALAPGAPCPRCRWPMYPTLAQARRAGLPPWLHALDLGDWPGRIYGGPQAKRLEHAHCNRSAGQAIAAARRRLRLPSATVTPRRAYRTRAQRAARW